MKLTCNENNIKIIIIILIYFQVKNTLHYNTKHTFNYKKEKKYTPSNTNDFTLQPSYFLRCLSNYSSLVKDIKFISFKVFVDNFDILMC
jgi:hypothetical protein